MELVTNEQKLNFLKSIEFELGWRVGLMGVLKAESASNTYRPEVMPYVTEWFRRRFEFTRVTNMLAHEIQMFEKRIIRDYGSLFPTPKVKVSYNIPSHADEMIKEGWKPNG